MSGARNPALDLWRIAATFSVASYHFLLVNSVMNGRPLGVGTVLETAAHLSMDLFFVQSGYLIASQLFASAHAQGRVSLSAYYVRRALRILPPYLAVLAYIELNLSLHPELSGMLAPLWAYLAFAFNFFREPWHYHRFLQVWSLCLEEHFYALLPLLFLLLRGRTARFIGVTITLALVGEWAVRAVLWSVHGAQVLAACGPGQDRDFCQTVWSSVFERPTYAHLDGFLIGVSLAACRVFRPERWKKWLEHSVWWLAGSLPALAVAVALIATKETWAGSTAGFTACALSLGAVTVHAESAGTRLARLIPHGLVSGIGFLGQLTYPIYLVHAEIVRALFVARGPLLALPLETKALLYLLMMLAISAALHFVVERPCLALRDRWLERTSLRALPYSC